MTKCGKKVTHMVRVVGKKKVGFVCKDHMEKAKEICVLENAGLNVEEYDGDKMFCMIPAGVTGSEEQKPFSINLSYSVAER